MWMVYKSGGDGGAGVASSERALAQKSSLLCYRGAALPPHIDNAQIDSTPLLLLLLLTLAHPPTSPLPYPNAAQNQKPALSVARRRLLISASAFGVAGRQADSAWVGLT